MARQANILSFDEARNESRSRRMRGNSDSTRTANRTSTRNSSRSSARAKTTNGFSFTRAEREASKTRDGQETHASSDGKSRPARTAKASTYSGDVESRTVQSSKRGNRQRERTKARANRMFDKQYEPARKASAPEDGTPRAALYETKMGSSHRKSARMQRSSSATPQTAKLDPAGWFSNLHIPPRVIKLGTALLCLVLVGVFLYTPARQYYQAQREHDKLAVEYSELAQRNDALDSQNGSLSSNAGMEDAVRQKYGYVIEGDQTAVVTGLSDTTTDSSRDSDGIEANVLSSAVKAPEEWYTPYLDAFFGIS